MSFTVSDFRQYSDPINMPPEYGLICRSQEAAKECCEWLGSIGNRWALGDSYLDYTKYEAYSRDGIIIYYNNGTYGDRIENNPEGAQIVEWTLFKEGYLEPEVECEYSEEINSMLEDMFIY